ncbi:MAG: hypothetical protein KAS30_03875 [Candidatus Diapherotrites archaeon]|nr:hypothetical protein [Candidatus Diapherotrites archaeon]
MVKLVLKVKHRTLGEAGSTFEIPEENVSAWIESGKAKLYSEDKPKKEPKKKGSKK